jgi:D-alanine-D-alanine ligase
MRIAFLHDDLGPSARADEADVFAQIEPIEQALNRWGHETFHVPCTLDLAALKSTLDRLKPDSCFNFVESLGGMGALCHLVPAALEAWRIPFTGNSSAAIQATGNKLIAKARMLQASIPTAEWRTREDLSFRGSGPPGQGRWIVKSVWEHASIGLDEDNVIEADGSAASRQHLLNELTRRLPSLGGEGFIERYVHGREFNISLLDGDVLPIAEMVFEGYAHDRPRVVGYRAKWDENAPEYHQTVRRFDFDSEDHSLLAHLRRLARETWKLFALRGWARVDFRVDDDASPFVLEVNTNPCLAPDAGFMAAAQRAGHTLDGVIDRLLNA